MTRARAKPQLINQRVAISQVVDNLKHRQQEKKLQQEMKEKLLRHLRLLKNPHRQEKKLHPAKSQQPKK